MDPLIRYINKNEILQDHIIRSSNSPLIEATYHLLLHYGCSLNHFIKSGFRHELNIQGIGSIFRENRKMNLIISDFFQRFGGSFDHIIEKISILSLDLKPLKAKKLSLGSVNAFDLKTTNKVLSKCLDLIEDQLISVVSDSLIDFCAEICLTVNTQSDPKIATGEGIVCSFIVFRILAPLLLEGDCCGGTNLDRLKEIVKGLTRISVGDTCVPNNPPDKFILIHNERFRNVVARTLMRHRMSPYCYSSKLSGLKYVKYSESLLDELNIFGKDELPLSYRDSLDHLLKSAINTARSPSIATDLQYFPLWSMEDVLTLIRLQGLNDKFFRRWNINGINFLQLDEVSLKAMGITDQIMINDILRCVADAKEFGLSKQDLITKGLLNWNSKDVGVWLALSGLSDLIGIFKTEGLDGRALSLIQPDDLRKIGITRPNDVTKIMRLVQDKSSE